jgi:ATP-binding cassette subfamily F protein uup
LNYLALEGVNRIYGDKVLFKNLNLYLNKGDKTALIAKNGTGKSSLLKTIMGIEPADNNDAIVQINKNIRIGYVPQEPELVSNNTVMEEIFRAKSPLFNAVRAYETCLIENVGGQKFERAMEDMETLQAWDLENKLKTILGKLKINDLHQKVQTLSGGQKKRVALAQILLEEPEVMILDEPTNHLDPEMIDWLADYISQERFSILLVTHDRYFMDKVCNEILELENGETYKYRGNYAYYVEKKAERQAAENANILRTKNIYRKELEWMRMTPQARSTKAKARIDRFEDIEKNAHRKIENQNVELEIVPQRLGAKVIELHNVSKAFGNNIMLQKFSYKFKRFEKVGIVGKNGVGKSTFLNLITKRDKPDSGEIILGDTLKLAFYTQDGLQLKTDKRVIEVVRDVAEYIPLTRGQKLTAAQLCERFLFDNNAQYNYVSKLSGGEKRRLYLLTLLMSNPNFLILDEPTNDLDIMTLNVLEEFLEFFPGCVLIVSHDRHFLDKIADHIFVFEGNGIIRDFNGTYSEYLESEKVQKKPEIQQQKAKIDTEKTELKPEIVKRKLSNKEHRELIEIENKLPELEKEKKQLEQTIAEQNVPYEQMESKIKRLTEVCVEIDEKTMRWLELNEI